MSDKYEIDHTLNPLYPDTNHDGRIDGIEANPEALETPPATLPDSDGDGTPDVWDQDDDDDGVLDILDISPLATTGVITPSGTWSGFHFDVTLPENSGPIYLTFQLRPQNSTELRLSMKAFDWPADTEGPIKDLDESPDDLTLIPMLEINTSENYLPPQDDVNDYGMVVVTDTETILAPLFLDEDGGMGAAFRAKLFYPTSTPAISETHTSGTGRLQGYARLVWMVRMENDRLEGEEDAGGGATQSKIESEDQVVARYATPFCVTGFNVVESKGTDIALVYDRQNVGDSFNSVNVAYVGLSSSYMLGITPTLDMLPALFATWGLTDTEIVSQTFGHQDEAIYNTTRYDTREILETFPITPGGYTVPILFLNEVRHRTLDLSEATGDGLQMPGRRFNADLTQYGTTIMRGIKMGWYNTESNEALDTAETIEWLNGLNMGQGTGGLTARELAFVRALHMSWAIGAQQLVQLDGIEIELEAPEGDEIAKWAKEITEYYEYYEKAMDGWEKFTEARTGVKEKALSDGTVIETKQLSGWDRFKAGAKVAIGLTFVALKLLNEYVWHDEELGETLKTAEEIYSAFNTVYSVYKEAKAIKDAAAMVQKARAGGKQASLRAETSIGNAAAIMSAIGTLIEFYIIWTAWDQIVNDPNTMGAPRVMAAIYFTVKVIILWILFVIQFIPVVGQLIFAIVMLVALVYEWITGSDMLDDLAQWVAEAMTEVNMLTEIRDNAVQSGAMGQDTGYSGIAVGSYLDINSTFTTTVHHTDATSDMGKRSDLKASALQITLDITRPVYVRDVIQGDKYAARSYQMGPWSCKYGPDDSYRRCTYPTGVIYQFNRPFINIPLEIGYETYAALVYRLCVSGKGCGRHGLENWDWSDMDALYMDVLPADPQGLVDWGELGRNDSDFDGLPDWDEPPACRYTPDCDGDGLSDAFERTNGTNPQNNDTDSDGLPDYWEFRTGLNPRDPDSDSDGLLDGDEWVRWSGGQVTGAWTFTLDAQDYQAWPNPLEPDADGDMLLDATEQEYGTNPNGWDPGGGVKWAVPDHAVRAGATITYALRYENQNPSLLGISDLTISDTLPAAYHNPTYTVQSDVPVSTTVDGNTYVWAMDVLSSGQAISITFIGQVDPAIADTQYITNVVLATGTYLGDIYQRQTQLPILVDMDPPSSTILGPVSGTIFSRAFLTQTIVWGQAGDPSSPVVDVVFDDGGGWQTVVLEGWGQHLSWQMAWPITTTDGIYTLRSRATDVAGNVETPGPGIQVLIDSTPPTSTITSLVDGQAVTATVECPDPVNAPYHLSDAYVDVMGLAADNLSGVDVVRFLANWTSQVVSGTTNWTTRWHMLRADGARFEGDYRLSSIATDVARNIESPYQVITVTIDNTPPTVELFEDPASMEPIITTTHVFTGTAVDSIPHLPRSESSLDERAGIATVEVRISGGAWESPAVQILPPRGITATWAYTWTPPADGTYTLTMRAADRAGNASGVFTYSSPIFADVTPPTSTLTSHTDGQTVKAGWLVLEGRARDAMMAGPEWVEVSTDGGGSWERANLRYDPSDGPGEARWYYDWEPSTAGVYTLTTRAADPSHVETPGPGITVTVDTSGPMAVIVTPRNGALISTTTVVTGPARAAYDILTGVDLYINGAPNTADLVTDTLSSGAWAYTWTLTADGAYTLSAEAYAFSGTPQSVTDTQVITVSVDQTPPDLTPGAGLPSGVFTGTQVVITGTVTDTLSGVRAVAVLTDTGCDWQPALVADVVWTYTWDLDYEDSVTHTVRQRASDHAGNVVSQTLDNLHVDNLPPTNATAITLSHTLGEWYDIGTGTPPSLVISATWSGAEDGAGLAGYAARWDTDPTGDPGTSASQLPDNTTANQVVDRPGSYYFHLRTGDNSGNWSYASHYGPIHIGGRETYGYAVIDGQLMTNEWFSSTHRLGVDPRSGTNQELFLTWDDQYVYLAWRGANWDDAPENSGGDLWVYFDNGTGGSNQTGISGVPQLPFQADAAYHVADGFSAELWQYSGGWITATSSTTTTFTLRNDVTEMRIALSDLGLVGQNEVRIVAFATGSPVWAVFPSTNPLDGSWSDDYYWLNFDGQYATPNKGYGGEIDEPQPQGLNLQLVPLSAPEEVLAPGDPITLTFAYTNSALTGLSAVPGRILIAVPDYLVNLGFEATHAFWPATPPWGGESRWEVQLTDSQMSPSLSPGKAGTLTMTASVATTLTQSALLTVTAEITGSAGTMHTYPDVNPADNVVMATITSDATPPDVNFGQMGAGGGLKAQLATPMAVYYVGGRTHSLLGASNDDLSGITSVEIKVGDGGEWRRVTGRSLWQYAWAVTGNDGDSVTFYIRATDRMGNTSTPTQVVAVLDLTPPSSNIVAPTAGLLQWSKRIIVTGTVSDAKAGVGKVEVSTDGGEDWAEADYVSDGTWGYLWTLPEAVTGTYTLTVRAEDAVGNWETPSEQVIVHTSAGGDTTGPQIGTPSFDSIITSTESLTVTANINDTLTGGHGVSSATLYYGYAAPYNGSQVAGTGPGGNGDGEWRFVVPSQGESHVDDTLRLYISAQDGDATPAATTNDNGGNYFQVQIVASESKVYLPLAMRNTGGG